MRTLRCAIATLSLLACTDRAPKVGQLEAGGSLHSPNCSVTDRTLITGNGLGDLRIGATVAEVKARCHVVGDSVMLGAEALPIRIVSVLMLDDTVHAEIDSGRVWRVAFNRARWRTAEGLGVGSRLEDVERTGTLAGLSGEGLVYVQSKELCGLSFRLDAHPWLPPPQWSSAELQSLRGSKVDQVLVFGCHGP